MVMPTTVTFGNPNPQMTREIPVIEDGEVVGVEYQTYPAPHLDVSTTVVEFWDGFDDPEFVDHTLSTDNDRMLVLIARGLDPDERKYAVGLLELEQIIGHHTGAMGSTWITSSDEDFARAAAKHFNVHLGEPQALLTNAGRDALHAQHLGTSAQPASLNYMALTANSSAAAAGDTTLTGEIATAGGGLVRAQATYAHTTGTNTSTLTKTFTANGSDSLPVTIAKMGIFNASSSGTLGYETLLNSTATLSASGDNVTITETVTAG